VPRSMSQLCYSGVTVVLHAQSSVTVVLQWCYSGVTVVLQSCYRYAGVTCAQINSDAYGCYK
jgi:hypothetical protein